ncbi:hypothetical protein [Streptosporangium roseum]|uniref:hypothetical protein n=1 Tax=Streptosporangium roseum TaxID=2001 RepID=UPI00332F0673
MGRRSRLSTGRHTRTTGVPSAVARGPDAGSPETVRRGSRGFAKRTGADEFIAGTGTHDFADRPHSCELLADLWST